MLKMIIKTFFFFLTPLDTYLQWCQEFKHTTFQLPAHNTLLYMSVRERTSNGDRVSRQAVLTEAAGLGVDVECCETGKLLFLCGLPCSSQTILIHRGQSARIWGKAEICTQIHAYISNLSPSLPLSTQVKLLWSTYFQTCCHTEKHWRNLIGCRSLWGHFHWRWLGRSTQRAHRGRLQGAWRSGGSGALVDLWGSLDFPGYCHALSCSKKKKIITHIYILTVLYIN